MALNTFITKKKIINAGPVNNFSNHSIVSENRVYKIPKKNQLIKYSLMGCAVPTAFHSIYGVLKIKKNSSLLITGMGGLGLSCLYAALKLNLKKIYCVDNNSLKLKVIKNFKNIIKINNKNKSLTELIKKNTIDNLIDCTGNNKIIEDMMGLSKFYGGNVLVIGNPKINKKITVDLWDLILGKSICGTWVNNKNFQNKFYKYLRIFEQTKLNEILVTKPYSLSQINKAFQDFKNGKVLRPIIKI